MKASQQQHNQYFSSNIGSYQTNSTSHPHKQFINLSDSQETPRQSLLYPEGSLCLPRELSEDMDDDHLSKLIYLS